MTKYLSILAMIALTCVGNIALGQTNLSINIEETRSSDAGTMIEKQNTRVKRPQPRERNTPTARPTTTTTPANTTRPTITDQEPSTTTHLRRAYRKSYKNFTSFMRGEYRMSYTRNFRNVQQHCDINNLFDRDPNSPDYLNPNACGADMKEAIMAFNEGFTEALSDLDDDDSVPTLQEFRRQRGELRQAIRELQQERRANRIPEIDMIYSLGQLMIMDIDYQIHKEILGL